MNEYNITEMLLKATYKPKHKKRRIKSEVKYIIFSIIVIIGAFSLLTVYSNYENKKSSIPYNEPSYNEILQKNKIEGQKIINDLQNNK